MVISKGRTLSSIENSRCQSVGLLFNAAAYEVLGTVVDADALASTAGVATRVPSGVWATTFEPSGKARAISQHT